MFEEENKPFISGRLARTARLAAEYYVWLDSPLDYIAELKASGLKADLFTFLQSIDKSTPQFDFHCEKESLAMLPITTFENWWKNQINDKTRNMIRKAQKSQVEIKVVEFSDSLIQGIQSIYDESPLRQGRPFLHYRKSLESLRNAHITFADRSQFIGAYYQNELIGFIKLVHDNGLSHLMQIISKISHRNKAPTNALIAKAVEICAQAHIPLLHYGVWSSRTLGDFKIHHAFKPFEVLRYYVPLNVRGEICLKLHLHHKAADYLPDRLIDQLVRFRTAWYAFRHSKSNG